MKRLAGLVIFISGLLAVLGNASQVMDFFEIRYSKVHDLVVNPHRVQPPGPAPRPEAPARPAHLVLIVKNVGGAREAERVDSLIAPFSARLIPEDSLSLITFTEAGHRFTLDRQSGDGVGEKLLDRVRHLVSVGTLSRKVVELAYDDARAHLESNAESSHTSAIVVLSPETTKESLVSFFKRIRSDTTGHILKFGGRVGERTAP